MVPQSRRRPGWTRSTEPSQCPPERRATAAPKSSAAMRISGSPVARLNTKGRQGLVRAAIFARKDPTQNVAVSNSRGGGSCRLNQDDQSDPVPAIISAPAVGGGMRRGVLGVCSSGLPVGSVAESRALPEKVSWPRDTDVRSRRPVGLNCPRIMPDPSLRSTSMPPATAGTLEPRLGGRWRPVLCSVGK